jgi:hypothetical protein
LRAEEMAAVHTSYKPGRPGINEAVISVASIVANQSFPPAYVPLDSGLPLPYQRTEYYTTEPNVTWGNLMDLHNVDGVSVGLLFGPRVRYPGPGRFRSQWNVAPYAPPAKAISRFAKRIGDTLQLHIPLFGDGGGHEGALRGGNFRLALLQNGTTLGEFSSAQATLQLPPGSATYRLEASTTWDLLELSTRLQMAWTFRSAHAAGNTPADLPLIHAQFKPPLNTRGEAAAGSVARIPILLRQDGSSSAVKVKHLTVDVSFDEGQSWKRVPVKHERHQWAAFVAHPKQGRYVSLRTFVSDLSGNTVEQTLIRAYALKAR